MEENKIRYSLAALSIIVNAAVTALGATIALPVLVLTLAATAGLAIGVVLGHYLSQNG